MLRSIISGVSDERSGQPRVKFGILSLSSLDLTLLHPHNILALPPYRGGSSSSKAKNLEGL